jgi:ubiquinone/menaquinone biosynthesis C-methylase UbiE
MSRLANPAKVYALDLDAGLIEHTRENVADKGEADLVVFAVDDAANLARYVSKPVSFVLLANTFHGVPDKIGLARTVVREVLAPGGKFAGVY